MRFQSFFADVAGGGSAFVALTVVAIMFAGIAIAAVIVASVFIIRYIKKKNANNK